MNGKRYVAGLMSALLLVGVPGVIQTAAAAPAAESAVVQTVSNPSSGSYQVKVTASLLNIRASANKNADIAGLLKKGDTVTIVSQSTDSRGVVWGELKSGGWINLSFTSRSSSEDSGSSSSQENVTDYVVKVTASSLNIRKSPNNTATKNGYLKKGDSVTITHHSTDSRGVVWGKLKSGAGWINLNFTSRSSSGDSGSSSSQENVTDYVVKVTANSLNIRKSPNNTAAKNGYLKKGESVTITHHSTDSRGVVWGKLKSGAGWINLNFTSRSSSGDSGSSSTSYTVKVTANSLTVRAKADKTSSVKGYLKKNDVVTITAEQKDSRGVTWGKLKSGLGWISLDYAKKTTSSGSDSSSFQSYKIEVTANTLNIRKNPSNTAAKTGYLKKGNQFTITAEQKDSRGVTWGKLSNGDGWINLNYTKKIS